MLPALLTIGHSNHSAIRFLGLLQQHSITLVCDVRSEPYSKYNPQFNRREILTSLERNHVRYVFLGQELGARSKIMSHYVNGRVQYNRVAASEEFSRGLDYIRRQVGTERIALLCAEKDPINCHRAILICRHLRSDELRIEHILEDGTLESGADLEMRLLHSLNLPEQDLFTSPDEMIERAYEIQGEKIAYSMETSEAR